MQKQAPPSAWTNLHNRRLQNLGGVPDSGGGMRPVPVPSYASAVFQALVQAGAYVSKLGRDDGSNRCE